jgi:hypothetical protein
LKEKKEKGGKEMNEDLKLILDNLTEDYAIGKDKFKQGLSKLKKFVFRSCLWFLASFLITAPILTVGIITESKTLIVTAGAIRAAVTLAFLFMLSPVGIAFEAIKEGIPGSIKRYMDFVRGLCISELILTAVIAWLPLKNNPDMIALFILLSMILSFLGSKLMSRQAATVIVSCLLFMTISSFFAPYSMQSLGRGLRESDIKKGMPSRIDKEMTCSGFQKGEYGFFGDKGESLKYYYRNWKTHEIEAYVLKSKNITHPQSGESLKPVTKEIVSELESQVCRKEGEKKRLEYEEKVRKEQEEAKRSAFVPTPAPPPRAEIPVSPPPRYISPDPAPSTLPAPQQKAHRYAILPGPGTGQRGLTVSQKIASTIEVAILDASNMDYQSASRIAEYLVVVEQANPPMIRSEAGKECCRIVLGFKIVDSQTGNTTRNVGVDSGDIPAFDQRTACEWALEAAVKTANVRLKKAL